jgi:hypothetical protein
MENKLSVGLALVFLFVVAASLVFGLYTLTHQVQMNVQHTLEEGISNLG